MSKLEKFLKNTALLGIGFVLQVGVSPNIVIGGVSPNFLLLAVIAAAITNGANSGAVIGFTAGLIFDMVGIGPVGLWALVFAVVGYLTGLIDRHLYAEGGLLPITVIALASFIAELSYLLIAKIFIPGGPLFSAIITHAAPTTLFTTFFGIFVVPLVGRLMKTDKQPRIFDRIG